MEKIIIAVIIAMLSANGASMNKEQAVALYQADLWDGTAITVSETTIEVRDGYLCMDNLLVPDLAPVDSAKDTTHAYVAAQATIKKWSPYKGSWIADWYRNELRFDVKGQNYKTINLKVKDGWYTQVKGKYIYVYQDDAKLYRVNIKTGKCKKLS
ncbi:MAG: hypothetical protein IK007_02345 [Lachnospiraceae bacterium]|nr:hypothetical protein [Lachnospiraceae bacterium]